LAFDPDRPRAAANATLRAARGLTPLRPAMIARPSS
jgi:hypothetical protein